MYVASLILISQFLGAFAKLRKETVKLRHPCLSIRPFVRPYGTTRLPLGGFS